MTVAGGMERLGFIYASSPDIWRGGQADGGLPISEIVAERMDLLAENARPSPESNPLAVYPFAEHGTTAPIRVNVELACVICRPALLPCGKPCRVRMRNGPTSTWHTWTSSMRCMAPTPRRFNAVIRIRFTKGG